MELLFSLEYIQRSVLFWIVAIVLILIGTFMYSNQKYKILSITSGLSIAGFGIYMLIDGVRAHPLSHPFFELIVQVQVLLGLVLVFSHYVNSIVYYRHRTKRKLSFQITYVVPLMISFIVLLTIIMLTNNIFVEDEPLVLNQYGEYYSYAVHKSYYAIVFPIFYSVGLGRAAMNSFKTFRYPKLSKKNRRKSLGFLILSFLICIATCISSFYLYLEDTGIISSTNRVFWLTIYSFLYLLAGIILIYTVVLHSLFIKDGKKLLNSFLRYSFSKIFLTLIVLYTTLNIIMNLDFPDNVPAIIGFLLIVVLFSSDIESIFNSVLYVVFKERNNTLSIINKANIRFLLKHYSATNQLIDSPLLTLHAVIVLADRHEVTKEQALQIIAEKALSSMKEKIVPNKRTKATLKYEIIRTIIQDQASESQILWLLGFKSSSVFHTSEVPRFPATKNSEYTATSRESYKRLRRDAILEFIWQVRQIEKEALRIR